MSRLPLSFPAARSIKRRRGVKAAIRISALILVPSLALAVWYLVAPSDRMAPPESDHYLPALIYDEYDLSAMALRGLNAEMGRSAGALKNPEMVNAYYFSRFLKWEFQPRSRYFLEYPHAILLLFRAGYWIQPEWREVQFPNAIPDCDYHNIAAFLPETESEFNWLKPLVTASHFYVAVMFVAYLGLILVLERGYDPDAGLQKGTLLLLLPATLFFALNRFDVLPALLTAIGFSCLGRRHAVPAAISFGMATVIKVYPILFAPLILRFLWPDRRAAVRFALAYAATGLLAFAPLLFGDDWQAVFAPYRFQLTRPPEHGMILYGCCLPLKWASGNAGAVFRLGSLAASVLLMLASPIVDLPSLLRRCSMVLLVFVSLAVFYSPQWILWFAPLLVPLVGRSRLLGWEFAALDAITYFTFPVWFWVLPEYSEDYFTRIEPLLLAHNWGDSRHVSIQLMSDLGNLLRLSRGICCLALGLTLALWEWQLPIRLRRLRFRQPQNHPPIARSHANSI